MTLTDITILDFSRLLPGPLATQLLAQLGARVIKVEHPRKADLARLQPPLVDGQSTLYRALNEGKEIRTIDYEDPGRRDELLALIREADVLVEQFRPGVMAAWGLDYETLKAENGKLIYVSLSGYGQDGPYRDRAGHDINYLAGSGILGLTRDAAGRPVIPGVQVADIGGGSYMVLSACLGALLDRARTGRGARVEVAMLDGLLPLLAVPLTQHWGGFDPYRMNFLSGALVNYNVYRCADGEWVALGALELKFWNNFCELVGRPQWQRDSHPELSVYLFPKAEVEQLFRSRSRDEWVTLAEGHDVCLTPVLSLEEMEQDPHIRHRGMLIDREQPDGRTARTIGLPFKIKREE